MRDAGNLPPFQCANAVYGAYALAADSPSAIAFGEKRLVLTRKDVQWMVDAYLPEGHDRRDPSVSPLYADLRDLPPALFSIGTDDPLLDDSLLMAQRYQLAGNKAELAVWAGGAHGVGHFGPHYQTALGKRCHERIEEFLAKHLL